MTSKCIHLKYLKPRKYCGGLLVVEILNFFDSRWIVQLKKKNKKLLYPVNLNLIAFEKNRLNVISQAPDLWLEVHL